MRSRSNDSVPMTHGLQKSLIKLISIYRPFLTSAIHSPFLVSMTLSGLMKDPPCLAKRSASHFPAIIASYFCIWKPLKCVSSLFSYEKGSAFLEWYTVFLYKSCCIADHISFSSSRLLKMVHDSFELSPYPCGRIEL